MTDTNPPVGATVVDSEGRLFEAVATWWEHRLLGRPVEYHSIRGNLTLVWRLQQERDQLRAENAALRAELAPLRALAVEAAQPKLGTAREVSWMCVLICDRLAALAPKEATDD